MISSGGFHPQREGEWCSQVRFSGATGGSDSHTAGQTGLEGRRAGTLIKVDLTSASKPRRRGGSSAQTFVFGVSWNRCRIKHILEKTNKKPKESSSNLLPEELHHTCVRFSRSSVVYICFPEVSFQNSTLMQTYSHFEPVTQ